MPAGRSRNAHLVHWVHVVQEAFIAAFRAMVEEDLAAAEPPERALAASA